MCREPQVFRRRVPKSVRHSYPLRTRRVVSPSTDLLSSPKTSPLTPVRGPSGSDGGDTGTSHESGLGGSPCVSLRSTPLSSGTRTLYETCVPGSAREGRDLGSPPPRPSRRTVCLSPHTGRGRTRSQRSRRPIHFGKNGETGYLTDFTKKRRDITDNSTVCLYRPTQKGLTPPF